MKLVGFIAVFIGGLVTSYLLISLGVVDAVDGLPGTQAAPALSLPTYLSFLGVMMTAVTVVLTAVAIGIGVIAAYTFREIKDDAKISVSKTVQEVLDEALSDEVIRARIDEIAFRNKRTHTLDELEQGFDPTDAGER